MKVQYRAEIFVYLLLSLICHKYHVSSFVGVFIFIVVIFFFLSTLFLNILTFDYLLTRGN